MASDECAFTVGSELMIDGAIGDICSTCKTMPNAVSNLMCFALDFCDAFNETCWQIKSLDISDQPFVEN